jgi:hypothetical protein
MAKDIGCDVQIEPQTSKTDEKRADLCIRMLTKAILVDVTIVNATCKSHAAKNLEKLEQQKMDTKRKLYEKDAIELGMKFVTFQMNVMGGFSKEANTLLKTIASQAKIDVGEFRRTLSTALQTANGRMLLAARRVAGYSAV